MQRRIQIVNLMSSTLKVLEFKFVVVLVKFPMYIYVFLSKMISLIELIESKVRSLLEQDAWLKWFFFFPFYYPSPSLCDFCKLCYIYYSTI